MKEKGITQYALIKQYNISPGQITRLKRNERVSTHTIEILLAIGIPSQTSLDLERYNLLSFYPFLNVSHLDRPFGGSEGENDPLY